MTQWFYFVRNGSRLVPWEPKRVPPRPQDALPAGGDLLTPWYETQDHYDDHHVHVLATSPEEAARKARVLLEALE